VNKQRGVARVYGLFCNHQSRFLAMRLRVRGSDPDPAKVEFTTFPQIPSCIRRASSRQGRRVKGREEEWKGKVTR